MDDQCASIGSHDQMKKKMGVSNAKDCTLACMNMGDKFILYDASTQSIYQLSDQKKRRISRARKWRCRATMTGVAELFTSQISNHLLREGIQLSRH